MDFLLAEIDRKKKQLDQNEVTSNKKYFKRGDLAAKQAEDKKRKLEASIILKVSLFKVIRRLRERNEPIRLFGELDEEACQRLRRIEMLAPEINKGLRNDFKAAMEKIDQEYLAQLVNQTLAKGMEQGDESLDQEVTYKFLQFLLRVWGQDLDSKPVEIKRSLEGKLAKATHNQTHSYLRPLLRKLKTKNTPRDIRSSLTCIIKNLLDREYVKANDSYLQMAIGNAPWPIGVTMVGIHARTGREKIFAQNVAHVLNDETQRKYIQGLKRLMTFCQKKFPADPSKSVDYSKEKD
ncbi:predicted protein [Nematostella vectensis]|uniref:Pre-mRNA-splicing factor 18 n=1 Tax=Nematostella vectensis TaxID=45351 RepID=A7RX18_NEMVE|nr:predicted protein [Nematostella vectensis]|eukprot:XP_001636012.1 predicted protein [Nematostella vectensis]